jgi:hypothetical protein
MDSNQTTTSTIVPPSPMPPALPPPSGGMFVSKVPSNVAFGIGILLFLMPFIDIKCNNMSLQQVSGLQLATGFNMKNNSSTNSYLDDIKTEKVDDEITKATTGTTKKDPNLYAMLALGLGVLGLILSFTNVKAGMGGAIATGVASAGALIGLMLDVKKKVKLDIPKTGESTADDVIGKVGDEVSKVTDNMNITVVFTPWFYIAIIAFLAAAFFCYRRMTALKK